MNELLYRLLALTLAGSCVAAVAAGAVGLLGKRAPGWFRYYLWLPVLLSFLLPLGLPGRPDPFLALSQAREGELTAIQLEGGHAAAENAAEGHYTFSSPVENRVQFRELPVDQACLGLWMAGTALVLGWKMTAYRRFRRRLLACAVKAESWEQELLERKLNGRRGPALLRASQAPGPMLVGLGRGCLVLPAQTYDRETLEDVLEHELCHWRRGDLWIKWLSQAVACVHWFNPVAWRLVRRVERDCELACDEAVLRGKDARKRLHYGRTLVLVAAGTKEEPVGLTAPMGGQREQLEERIKRIMEHQTLKKRTVAALCAAALLVALSTTVFGASMDQEPEQSGTSDVENVVQQLADETLEEDLLEDLEQAQPEESGFLVPIQTDSLVLSALYGTRVHPLTGETTSHAGIDIVAGQGTEILASKGGVVITSTYNSSYGNYVVISHGNNQTTLYANMSERKVSEGDIVTQGQVIGLVGATGTATGPHLHFEVREDAGTVDPLDVLDLETVYVRASWEKIE